MDFLVDMVKLSYLSSLTAWTSLVLTWMSHTQHVFTQYDRGFFSGGGKNNLPFILDGLNLLGVDLDEPDPGVLIVHLVQRDKVLRRVLGLAALNLR